MQYRTLIYIAVLAVLVVATFVVGFRYEIHQDADGNLYEQDRLTGRMWLVVRDQFYPVGEMSTYAPDSTLNDLHSRTTSPLDSFPRGLKLEWKLSGAYRFNTQGQKEIQLLWRIRTGDPPEEKSKDKPSMPSSIGIELVDAEGFVLYEMPSSSYENPVRGEESTKVWSAGGELWVIDQIARQTASVSPIWIAKR